MIRHFINHFLAPLPPSRLFSLRRVLLIWAGVALEKNVSFCGGGWIYGRGKLQIGSGTWLSPGIIFYTHLDADIIIGRQCDIGPGVKIIVGTHRINSADQRAGEGIARTITIGDGCWIGASVIILDGVTIGEGCVIAAGAVVTRDVKNNVLVAGVPAVVKRELA
jgi:maltose O-acetyltransferase